MTFSLITKLFGTSRVSDEEKEIERIFTYLYSLTKQKQLVEPYKEELDKLLQSATTFDPRYIRLYLRWEYVVANQQEDEIRTPKTIRAEIAEKYNISLIDQRFRLLFLPASQQARAVFEIFSQHIFTFLVSNSGLPIITPLIQEFQKDSIWECMVLTPEAIQFDECNKKMDEDNLSDDKIVSLFKELYTVLFTISENLYGTKTAAHLFNKIYKTLKQTYDQKIAGIFLRVIPEQVLEFDDWLATLSKEELEKKVKEQTQELETLNKSLEKKVAERTAELQKAYDDLKVLDKRKSEFISVAAHQMRTPLSGFRWSLDLLLNGEMGDLNDSQRKIIEKSIVANNQMITVVDDLLNSDIITSGKMTLAYSKMSLTKLIEEILQNLDSVIDRKKMNIVKKGLENDISISADKEKLKSAIQNIIDNALKYTPDGGTVTIEIATGDAVITCNIIDTGIGIPEKDQEHIFEQFFRADNAIRTHANGSGIGLQIAKNIIESHHGTLTFTSKQDHGTTFTFTLPLPAKEEN